MPNWQTRLELGDVYHDEDRSVQELAVIVAARLKAIEMPPGWRGGKLSNERDGIVDEFEGLATDPNGDVGDFDCVMERLYDWADTPLDAQWNGAKLCWVETLGRPAKT